MEFQNAIFVIVAMEHRPNWQDWGGRWGRRTEFMRHLKTVLEDLDIRYMLPMQPVLIPKGMSGGFGGGERLSPGGAGVMLQEPPSPRMRRMRTTSQGSRRSERRGFH